MIVSCEKCATQFQLDEAKIPETGTRVRCSRCKHSFFLEHPSRSDVPAAEGLAREAVGMAYDADDSESDWQFNEDPVPSPFDAAPGPAEDPFDAAPGPAEDPFEDTPDIGAPPPDFEITAPVMDDVPSEDLRAEDASEAGEDLGGEEDLLSQEPDDAPAAGSLPPLSASTALEEETGEDLSTRGLQPLDAVEPVFGHDSSEPDRAESELGDPEEWNFFDGGERSSESGTPAVLGKIELVKVGTLEEAPPRVRPRRVAAAEEPSEASLWVARAGAVAGWTATLGILIAGLYAGFAPLFAAPAEAVTHQAVAGLEAAGIEGRWVENTVAGRLFVVSGELVNPQGGPAAAEALLRVELLDDQGAPVPSEAPVLGPPQPDFDLRERNPRDLRAEQDLLAHRLAWVPLVAGERRPFQAIFAEVPEAATRFRIGADRSVSRPEPVAPAEAAYD